MVGSSEFIKGYTEIVVCALLFRGDDYIYSLVKRITECGRGEIRITNPSELAHGALFSSAGRAYYLQSRDDYLGSLRTLQNLVKGDIGNA